MDDKLYEVVLTQSSTFGDDVTEVTATYVRQDSARVHAYLASQGWGCHAYVRPVSPTEVSKDTPQQVKEKFDFFTAKRLTRKQMLAIMRGENP